MAPLRCAAKLPSGNTDLRSAEWSTEHIWPIICDFFKVSRVARKSAIADDDFRSPRVELLHGFHDESDRYGDDKISTYSECLEDES